MGAVDLQRAQAAQDRLAEQLGDHPGVTGIGIARAGDGYIIKVNVRTEEACGIVPAEIDDVPIRVQRVGRIRKRQAA